MADNVAITAGSGTTIATDDVATVHYQRVKLVNGTLDATDAIPGDVNGLYAQGGIAHDTADAGNPIKLGQRAINHGANPTAVAAADRTDWLANRAGVPFVIGGHPNIQTVRLNFTAAQTNTAVIAGSANVKIMVTSFMFTLDNASTGFPSVLLGFAAATTPTTTQVIGAHGGIPAGGGFGRGDGSGIIGISAGGDALLLTTVTAATGNGVNLVVTYYTITET